MTVEGEVYVGEEITPLKLRLSTTLTATEGNSVNDAEVREATESLKATLLETLKGLAPGDPETRPAQPREGPTRSLDLLREVYTPRSRDHVDALLWEGEITKEEHTLLSTTLKKGDHRPASPLVRQARTPEELIKEFNLRDLGDANRVRGRRLISYDEWATLKIHFSKMPQSRD